MRERTVPLASLSRRSAQATTTVLSPVAHAAGIVNTRNLPPGNSGNAPGSFSGGAVSGVIALARTCAAENVVPPSVDFTNFRLFPARQTTYTSQFRLTAMSGENESCTASSPTPGELFPTPFQFTPSLVRANRSVLPSSQAA